MIPRWLFAPPHECVHPPPPRWGGEPLRLGNTDINVSTPRYALHAVRTAAVAAGRINEWHVRALYGVVYYLRYEYYYGPEVRQRGTSGRTSRPDKKVNLRRDNVPGYCCCCSCYYCYYYIGYFIAAGSAGRIDWTHVPGGAGRTTAGGAGYLNAYYCPYIRIISQLYYPVVPAV